MHRRATTCLRESGLWAASVSGVRSWDAYEAHFGSWRDQRLAARYVRDQTSEQDPVLVWGFDPLINYRAQRQPPTRFGFCYPLYAAQQSMPDLYDVWRRELLEALRSNPPRYVVVVHHDRNDLMLVPPAQFLETVDGLPELLTAYERETAIGDFAIWRRVEPLPPPHGPTSPPG